MEEAGEQKPVEKKKNRWNRLGQKRWGFKL